MIDRLFHVFHMGATLADKIAFVFFYVYLFVSHRFGGRSSFTRPRHVCIRFEDKVYDMYLKSLSDVHAFFEVFVDESYRVQTDDRIKRVVDLGSGIGASLIYLAHRFPSAVILSVEPHPGCLEILHLNAEQFGDRIRILPVAACEKDGEALLYPGERDGVEIASTVHREKGRAGICVPCATISNITGFFGDEEIDFMKCDIEGAEFEVFSPQNTLRIKRFIGDIHSSITKKLVSEFMRSFPYHQLVREQQVGDHVHVELVRKDGK